MTAPAKAPAFIRDLPSRQDVRRALAERSLAHFFVQAWPSYKPGREYFHNWHIDAVCEHVQAVLDGQISQLIINIPHRHTKSSVVAVTANAWEWGPRNRAWTQWLGASGAKDNAARDSRETRTLITSPWYQQNWGDRFVFRADQNEKLNFENDKGGSRLVLTPKTKTIGKNADRIFVDDPNDTVDGTAGFVSVAEWWDDAMSSRLNNPKAGGKIVIQQRLDERDLTGHLLEQGGWELLMLPAEFEPERRCIIVPTGFKDPRTVPGEPLDKGFHGTDWIEAEKARLLPYRAAGMLQQRPAPKGGGMFKRDWYPKCPRHELPQFFHLLLSWDTATTDNEQNDQSACTAWGLSSEDGKRGFFKVAQWADWLEIPELIAKVDSLRQLPQFRGAQLLIENKNSGPAVIQHLQRKNVPVTPYEPKGSKEDRAVRVVSTVEAGLVWLVEADKKLDQVQHAKDVADNEAFLSQSDVFPNGKLRDIFDCAVQAWDYGIATYTFESSAWEYISSSTSKKSKSYHY